jgi:hypothetical protein
MARFLLAMNHHAAVPEAFIWTSAKKNGIFLGNGLLRPNRKERPMKSNVSDNKFFLIVNLISLALFTLQSGCSSGRIFVSTELANVEKEMDTVSIVTDGVVFYNSNVVFLDVRLSDAYGYQSSIMAEQILLKRGYKVGEQTYSNIGTFLDKDSTYLILPQGGDSIIYRKPPFVYKDSYQIDSLFLRSQIRITRFLNCLQSQINDKTRFPDSLADDLAVIRKKMKSRYLCLSYFSGLSSEMISENTKIIWGVSSRLASGGLLTISPHAYSSLNHIVFLIDLGGGRILYAYKNSFLREKRFLDLLGISWYEKVQWEFPCKKANCPKPSIFYNPLKVN